MHLRDSPLRSQTIAKACGAVLVFVALAAWAFASPVGASPDEDFHLASTWCGSGLQDGVCEVGEDDGTRTVPLAILTASCYAFDSTKSASCQGDSLDEADEADAEMIVTVRGNFRDEYPPVFFFFTSLFVGEDVAGSVLAMRLANAALFVLMIAATYLASPVGLRRAMLLGAAVTAVPLGMFIIPSVNPSSWAVLSAATFLVSVLGYLTADQPRRRIALGAMAGLALLVGAGSRGDAALYAVVAVVVAFVLAGRRDRAGLRRMIYPVVLAITATLAYLSTSQGNALEPSNPQPVWLGRVVRLLVDVPDLWVGALGKWGLGWLDTAMPPLVWVGSSAVFAGVVYAALHRADLRKTLAVSGALLAVWLVPAWVLYATGYGVGAWVQPRYILPLLTLLAVTAVVRLEGAAFQLSAVQRWLLVGALSAANGLALYANIRRYVTGYDVTSLNLDAAREWWWEIPATPTAVWLVGALAFAGGLLLLSAELRTPQPALAVVPLRRVPATVTSPQTPADQAAPPVADAAPPADETPPADDAPPAQRSADPPA